MLQNIVASSLLMVYQATDGLSKEIGNMQALGVCVLCVFIVCVILQIVANKEVE